MPLIQTGQVSLPLFRKGEVDPEKLSDLIKVTYGQLRYMFENNFQKHKKQEL